MQKNNFVSEYNYLNTAQKEAVDNIYWPIMVVAWPWTWKTQIIWLRTANIILQTWVNPENILITTFTEAWVIAIRKRLVKFLWNAWYKVTVSTIHSFAQDIIKTFPEKFIEFKAWNAIDEVDSLEIIRKIIDKLVEKKEIEELTNSYDKYFYLRDIKSRISTLKQEWINSKIFLKKIEKQCLEYETELSEIKPTLKKYQTTQEKQEKHIKKLKELVIFFDEYNNYLREYSLYDFNDMINFVLEKFEIDEELKEYYAETFQFIMLDEYQDTNNAQNKIIELILSVSQDEPNIMTVWDDDQSIYRFQWANIENMLDFSNKYQNTKFIVLEENYRSNQNILDLSSNLIKNNEERLSNKISTINKELKASWNLKYSENKPKLFRANSIIDEQTFIINKIKNYINEWIPKDEIAIIVRWNREVEEWSNILQKNSLEVESKLKTNILNSDYVNYILNYLELINNPFSSEEKLINLMKNNITWLEIIDILKINRELYIENYRRKFNKTFIEFLDEKEKLEELELKNLNWLIKFKEKLIELWGKVWNIWFYQFFGELMEELWIVEYVEKNWDFWDIEDIYTLFNKIKDWNLADNTLNVERLLSKIELYKKYNFAINRQILSEKKWWVQILTWHSSKWLEYEIVFVTGLYTWNWESKTIRDKLKLPNIAWDWIQEVKNNQIEEDRRLFFVAVTRAKDQLFLSYPAWIWNKPLIESQFVNEISWFFEEEDFSNNNKAIIEIAENDLKNKLIKYSDQELEYIKSFLENYKLSASDLNAFIEDPLIFLQRVIFKYPFIDNKFTIFWKVYHRTLELFYLKFKSEWKLPEKSYLTSTFELLIKKEILTPDELEEALEKGISWLEWYYDLYSYKKDAPLLLEHSFRKKNLFFEEIPLTWTIDKIEKIWETTNNSIDWQLAFFKESVALIDYKTWKTKSNWQIKWIDRYWNKKEWEWKYFRQLLFYKLLCEVDFEFKSKFEVWSLAIDFVEWKDWIYKYVEVDFSDEEYKEFKEELLQSRKKINDIEFWKNILK